MDIRIYDLPELGTSTFRAIGRVTEAPVTDVVERLWIPGAFTIEVPTGARHGSKLTQGRAVWIEQGLWGIIDDVCLRHDSSGAVRVVSGRQLKGLTLDRITIPPASTAVTGAQGYDTATGTTETVMKHFVLGNMLNGAQPARMICGLEVADDLGRGLPDDKYMSRHDVLADVLAALGEAAGLGYDIVPDLALHKLVFDVVTGEDHTARQSERPRVVFSIRRRSALSQEYVMSTGDSRNVFYATLSGSEFVDETLTATYIRDGEEEPIGLRRREKHLSISADTPTPGEEYSELRRKALIEAESFCPAESFTCEIAPGPVEYRRDYQLGDLVSVINEEWGVEMHTRITEMRTSYTASGVTYTATFGTAPLNVFGRLRRQMEKGK